MKRITKMLALLTALAMILAAGTASAETMNIRSMIAEHSGAEAPESAAELIQPILYQETVGSTEITIQEAAYDGRSLFLVYSFRMTDVDHPLGLTAGEFYGEELPEDMDPNEYVYGMTEDAEDLLWEHGVGWWMDGIWINGTELNDMPEGSGQYLSGTDIPGELVENDIWRLDNVGVFLDSPVQISLPIGKRQDYMEFTRSEHPEKYDADGRMILPEKGMITFTFDPKDVLSSVRVFRPEGETAAPVAAVKVAEAAFSPLMTYITLDLTVNPDAMDAFIAENGEGMTDDNGEIIWPYGPMDVFGEWVESLMLTDGNGTVLFPDVCGMAACSDEGAEFLLPCLETLPDALYLAPVSEEGAADMTQAIPLF